MLNQSSQTTSSAFDQWIKRNQILAFFILAYGISWVLSIPFILKEWGILAGDYRLFFIIKSFGPYLAALILTHRLEGKDGLTRFRSKIRQYKVGSVWYLISLIGIPALFILGVLVQPGTLQGFKGMQVAVVIQYLASFVLVAFGGGPLGEEPGWRGFALPRMQKKYGPLLGTLLLSIGWTCWHLPDFLTSAQGGGPGTGLSAFWANFPIFLALVTSLAVILTWVYNRTGGSVFLAILVHASVNTPQVALAPLFPALDTTRLNTAALIGFGLAAVLVLAFTRGRLGYRQDLEENG
jgi:uncharacterized protein